MRNLTLGVLFLSLVATQAEANTVDRSLSPYFFVEGKGDESLALEGTSADVKIAGVIADVKVTQHYKNDGKTPINAKYVFPASTRAAVHGMSMTIGNRRVEATIREKKKAREEYEAAVREGKSATLLEQDRPNVFTMKVGNIMPGDKIRVELRYTESIVPTDGIYEFVYPAVVGPRFAGETVDASDADNKFVASAYTPSGASAKYAFRVNTQIGAGMPVYDVRSPSHSVKTTNTGAHELAVAMNKSDQGNRDYILRYRLAGKEVASGLMLYEGKDENFFMMMVQPPQRPEPSQIPDREYVFVVDVSGSMHGFPLDVTAELAEELLKGLGPRDLVNVMLFSGGSKVMSDKSIPATPDNVRRARDLIQNAPGGGGTMLKAALERAMNLPTAESHSRVFVVVTDGYISAEAAAFKSVRDNLGTASMFVFGIGRSVNRHLVEGLAKAGIGEPFVATSPEEAKKVARSFREYIESPVLTNVKVAYKGFQVYDQQPTSIPDVFASRPVVVYGKYKGKAAGSVELTGVSGRGRFVNSFDAAQANSDGKNSALKYLWARSRIADLSDFGGYSGTNEAEVTRLGLKYSLLTKYTSFIAVDKIVRNTSGLAKNTNVPLPMPAGVSNLAVAAAEDSGAEYGPEPELYGLLVALMAFVGLVAFIRRRTFAEVL